MTDPTPLQSEADYESALREIEAYFENTPAPGTPAAARFNALSALIKDYEDRQAELLRAAPGRLRSRVANWLLKVPAIKAAVHSKDKK